MQASTVRRSGSIFGNYKQALEECNLEVPERGRKVELDRLFLDWAEVVRAFKKIPTVWEYERRSKYSSRPLMRCAGSWNMVAERMKLYAEEHGLNTETCWNWLSYSQEADGVAPPCRQPRGLPRCLPSDKKQPTNLWGADRSMGTRLWADERRWSDCAVWSHGSKPGVPDTEDADGVSGLRSGTHGR